MTGGRRHRLRTQLIGVVGGVALLLSVLLGAVSTLALRSSLLGQVDDALLAAADRSARVPGADELPWGGDGGWPVAPGGGDEGTGAGDGTGTGDGTAGGESAEGGRTDDGVATEGGYPAPPWGGDPSGLNVRGQATGTAVVEVRDGSVVNAGYLDDAGRPQELSDAQAEALLAAGHRPTWVGVPDLGTYRAVVVERSDGSSAVTALPWSHAEDTLRSYVVVEIVVGAVALALALALATVLVRRALRPLDRVAQTATRVSELPLDRGDVTITERVPERDTDERTEVGTVGAALNRMLGHVESSLAARHASETKVRTFVADASHELRTPLASIRGYSELVLRRGRATGGLDAETEHAIGRVSAESQRMQALVADLLLLARLDAGRELDDAEVDLLELALDATSDAHAAGRDHAWHLDVPDVPVPPVLGDEARLRQVLANLLANARVHTPAGTTVTTALRALPDAVELTVTDDGPGIDPELVPSLFDRFTRGDTARVRGGGEVASTGLGLAIADAIVTAHGGRIEVDSRPGRTRFTVVLPTAPTPGSGARVASPAPPPV